MKRRFAIPAAIALTAHALLFVGSGKPPAPIVSNPPTVTPGEPSPLPVDLVDLTPPPEDEDPSGDGSSVESPVSILEPPPIAVPTGPQIEQPYIRSTPGTAIKLDPGMHLGRPVGGGGSKLLTPAMLDAKPRTRFQKAPVYPNSMRIAGTSGTVWVEFMVDETGRVHDVRVIKSAHPDFEAATITAVSEWRFEPGTRNRVPVRFRMSIPVVFNLTT
jgi:periplasmic protein TonB